ncbi:MAG: UDP-N-acetylmuramoyl-L-alanyl-D-glutamate--2,6-diaminopimelate ligase [Acidimicrobiales bacterium]
MTTAADQPPAGPHVRFAILERGSIELAAVVRRLEDHMGPVDVVGSQEGAIVSVCYDHRSVYGRPNQPAKLPPLGELFCCLPGELHDGHDYAAQARANGAVAFICERDLGDAAGGATQLIVGPGKAREAMAHAACLSWRDPATKLRTVGVTGTNGKTTTTYLIRSVLEAAGYSTTVVGTLSGARTTPESPDLQGKFELARVLASRGRRPGAVALEVTSHALVQHRVDGYVHDVVVFTNLSRDHLDFHRTMGAYFDAKKLLFTPGHARAGVVNVGDRYGRRLVAEAGIEVTAFSIREAFGLEMSPAGSRFQLGGSREVSLPLVGRFNVENALAAAAAARALGVEDEVIAEGLSAVDPVPGRLEPVATALELTVLVDYAHTPAGLENACRTLRDLAGEGAHLIVVFGAGGDRDRQKRPRMGHHASHLAHVVVLTSDNPRHEDPSAIIEAVRKGCDGPAELHVEPDRRRAIALALSLGRPGDVLLVAGKGHETTQQVGDEFLTFDDRVVVAEEAERLAGAA